MPGFYQVLLWFRSLSTLIHSKIGEFGFVFFQREKANFA